MAEVNEMESLPEGWRRVRLGEVIEEIKRNSPKGSFPYIEIGDIDIETKKYSLKEKPSPERCIKVFQHEIIVSKVRPTRGAISLIKNRILFVSPAFFCFKSLINYKFVFFYLSRREFFNYLGTRETGTTYPSINDKDILSFNILFPDSPEEQRKIAEILETIDNAIEKTDQIIEKYKRIKQGLMQELLTKGIDENGQIRSEKTHKFKDSPLGRIPEEWEYNVVKHFMSKGVIEKIQDGNHGELHPKEDEFTDEGIPFITAQDITNSKVNLENCRKIPLQVFTRLRKGILKDGDLLLTHKGTIGLVAIYKRSDKAVLSPQVTFYRIFEQETAEFLYYFFQSYYFQDQLEILSKQTTRDYIGLTKQEELIIAIPKSKKEQQRIASILSQIDEVIEKEQNYKQKLERIKQGLMEDLLTGKVRVNCLIEEV